MALVLLLHFSIFFSFLWSFLLLPWLLPCESSFFLLSDREKRTGGRKGRGQGIGEATGQREWAKVQERERDIYIYQFKHNKRRDADKGMCRSREGGKGIERERQVKPLHHSPGEKERESERETERSMKTWKEEMMIKNVLRFS